jgi:hypothetical protein
LIAAYINERDMPVRDFVSNFAGLARNKVRADVLTEAEIQSNHLSDLVRGDDVDMASVQRLLGAMQKNSKPVIPKRLGIIGKDHLKFHLESQRAVGFNYQRKAFIDDEGLPVVLEIAFGTKLDADEYARRIIGLNWSPIFKIPSGAIEQAINKCQVNDEDPVILLIHAARPRFEFTDHGKGSLS